MHNLDITDDQASFVSANTMGWHQLGELVEGAFDAETAMEKGKLGGWDVRKIPAFGKDPETGLVIPMPGRYATVRNNPVRRSQIDYLGDVGESWVAVQNEQHAEFLNILVDESGAHFDTAGALNGGRQVFITMKLPGHINIGGVDPIANYIAAINDHAGDMSFTLMVTPIRIVCENTLNCAFCNKSHMIRIRHTSGAEKNLRAKAREALDLTFNYLDGFQEEADKLVQTVMTEAQFESIITREFGPQEGASPAAVTRAEKKVEEMMDLFCEAQTQDGIRDTAWAGFNALTEWNDHFSPTRGNDRDTARAQKAILDPSFKNRALSLMLAAV